MEGVTRNEMENIFSDKDAVAAISDILENLDRDKTVSLDGHIAQKLTYEDLLGALNKAEDEIGILQVEEYDDPLYKEGKVALLTHLLKFVLETHPNRDKAINDTRKEIARFNEGVAKGTSAPKEWIDGTTEQNYELTKLFKDLK